MPAAVEQVVNSCVAAVVSGTLVGTVNPVPTRSASAAPAPSAQPRDVTEFRYAIGVE